MNTSTLVPKHLILLFALAALTQAGCTANKDAGVAEREPGLGEAPTVTAGEPGLGETPAATATTSSFLVVSDIHLGDEPADPCTDSTEICAVDKSKGYCKCSDTGQCLWDSTQDQLRTVLNGSEKPGFVLYLGDLPEHNIRPSEMAVDMKAVLGGLRTIAQAAQVPVLYLPGNNDSLDGDYCPFKSASTGTSGDPNQGTPLSLDPGQGWPLAGGNGPCDADLTNKPCIKDGNPDWGYFSAYPLAGSNLRVVALNTAAVSTNTMCDATWQSRGIDRAQVAADQFDWFEGQMEEASCTGQPASCEKDRVLVAMHVPPGIDGYSGDASWRPLTAGGTATRDRFLGIMKEHPEVVMGTLTAHSHMEEIRRLHSDCGAPAFDVALSLPGITPPHGNNPAFKVFHYDAGNVLTDFNVHYRPLDSCSTWLPWASYSFKDVTGCTGTSIFDCVTALGTSGIDQYEITNGYYPVLSGRGALKHQTMYDVWPTSCGSGGS